MEWPRAYRAKAGSLPMQQAPPSNSAPALASSQVLSHLNQAAMSNQTAQLGYAAGMAQMMGNMMMGGMEEFKWDFAVEESEASSRPQTVQKEAVGFDREQLMNAVQQAKERAEAEAKAEAEVAAKKAEEEKRISDAIENDKKGQQGSKDSGLDTVRRSAEDAVARIEARLKEETSRQRTPGSGADSERVRRDRSDSRSYRNRGHDAHPRRDEGDSRNHRSRGYDGDSEHPRRDGGDSRNNSSRRYDADSESLRKDGSDSRNHRSSDSDYDSTRKDGRDTRNYRSRSFDRSRPMRSRSRGGNRARRSRSRRGDVSHGRSRSLTRRRSPSKRRSLSRQRIARRSRSREESRRSRSRGKKELSLSEQVELAAAEQRKRRNEGIAAMASGSGRQEPRGDNESANKTPSMSMLHDNRHYKVLKMQAIQVRSLLGKGGETVNQLRRKTGSDIKIHHPPMEALGTVSIVGDVERTMILIEEVLAAKGCPLVAPGAKPPENTDEISIAPHLVGLFVGTAGMQIRELQNLCGGNTCISVQPPEVPGGLQRIRIVGDNREKAKALVKSRVDAILTGKYAMDRPAQTPESIPGVPVVQPGKDKGWKGKGKGFAGAGNSFDGGFGQPNFNQTAGYSL